MNIIMNHKIVLSFLFLSSHTFFHGYKFRRNHSHFVFVVVVNELSRNDVVLSCVCCMKCNWTELTDENEQKRILHFGSLMHWQKWCFRKRIEHWTHAWRWNKMAMTLFWGNPKQIYLYLFRRFLSHKIEKRRCVL